jgi:superfamily II DNA or RNA helicase
MKLIKRTEINKPKELFNLHIEQDHNYIVEGAVVANCHGIKAEKLKELLSGVMSHIPLRWGLTGTIPKEQFEFMSLRVSIGEVINRLSASELQEKGVLSNCQVHIAQLQDFVEYRDYQGELKYLTTTENRLQFIAGMIEKISESGNTLVLVDRIQAGELLRDNIPDSVFISGGTNAKNRKEQYDDIATSDNRVLIATFGIAAVGINIVRLHNIVLLEPGKSFVRTIQSIGRGLRKGFEKDFVNIWDITSNCKFSKRHLSKRKVFYKEAQYPFTMEKVSWKDQ